MSSELTEFREAYLAEADELLGAARRQLLALDASVRKGEPNLRAVRELFRAMHTVKGLSAMVGVEPIVAIAHCLESILRAVERDGLRLDVENLDDVGAAVRAIEQRLRAVSADRPVAAAPRDLVDRLEAIERARAPRAQASSAEIVLDPALASKLGLVEREQLEKGVALGRRVVQLTFTPTPSLAEAGIGVTSVREQLAALGDIVKIVPRATTVTADAPGGLSFVLLVLVETLDAIASAALPGTTMVVLEETRREAPKRPLVDEEEESELPGRAVVRVSVDRLDEAMEHLSSLIVTRHRLERAARHVAEQGFNARELQAVLDENARLLRELRGAVLRLRMVPMSEVLERLPLLVRGLARETGKQARITIDAGDAELDKAVAEQVFPSLVHIVRNAVDHGIEPADERTRRGKPDVALLSVVCVERSDTQLEIVVSDDGRGIDAQAIAARAARPSPRTETELLAMMCEPGLSTRAEASTTSGRGMGMDIVRRAIVDGLGGELALSTRVGAGTSFSIRIPLTISIVDAFTFECADERFCVPVSAVEEIVDLEGASLVRGPGTDRPDTHQLGAMERRGETLTLVSLARIIGRSEASQKKALVVRRNGEPIAFAIDRMLGQEEVVVRPIVDPLARVRGVAGSTDLGDGKPTLVLDLYALVARRELTA